MLTNLAKTIHAAAAGIQADAESIGLRRKPTRAERTKFRQVVEDSDVRDASEKLYDDGHYDNAIQEAFKVVNNYVKTKSGLAGEDGADLMRKAFSPKSPKLAFSPLKTTSQTSQQQGYMEIYAGCMTGIRNPSAHEHKYLNDPDVALKLIAWADHLMAMAKKSTKKKHRKTKATS